MTGAMTWILLAVLVLLTSGLAASVCLVYSVKRQVWQAGREAARRETEITASLTALQSDYDSLRSRFDELEQRSGMLVAPAPALSGFNLTKRTQALRMLARGEKSENIAAALNLPHAETALLMKVRRLHG